MQRCRGEVDGVALARANRQGYAEEPRDAAGPRTCCDDEGIARKAALATAHGDDDIAETLDPIDRRGLGDGAAEFRDARAQAAREGCRIEVALVREVDASRESTAQRGLGLMDGVALEHLRI